MKTIILYVALALSLAGAASLGYLYGQQRAVVQAQQAAIARQEALIQSLAQQEAIAIHIANTFSSRAVLGKVVVDANVQSVAEQVASILRSELQQPVELGP
jgi:hypothetical protein